MDKFLRPKCFDTNPSAVGSDKQWIHWFKTFENFVASIESVTDNLVLLTNYVAPDVYKYIADCTTYTSAINTLKALYFKPKNEIYARHVLATRCQEDGQSLDEYIRVLKQFSKDCNFTDVTAELYRQNSIRDAIINGLHSFDIRRRLLENLTLTLDQAFEQARALEMAHKNSASYKSPIYSASTTAVPPNPAIDPSNQEEVQLAATRVFKCFFCGLDKHGRTQCPAKDSTCNNCGKIGHYARVCLYVNRPMMMKVIQYSVHHVMDGFTTKIEVIALALLTKNLEHITQTLTSSGSVTLVFLAHRFHFHFIP